MSKWQEQARKYVAMFIIFVMAISWLPTYGYATGTDVHESEEIIEEQQEIVETNEEIVERTSPEQLKAQVTQSVQNAVQFYKNNLPTYKEGQIGTHSDFWVYSALWSAGIKDLRKDLKWPEEAHPWADFTFWSQGKTAASKDPNENAGIIIGSKLLGLNPTTFGEQNAVEDLLALQRDNGMFSTIWGEAWALIALDLVDATYDRDKQIASMLKTQNAKGVFGDTDATGWTLLALAPYMDQSEVKEAINQAVNYIHAEYMENDVYPGMFGPNANTTAAVVMGLAAVGEDLYSDKWNKPSGSLVADLMDYQQDNGSFWWKKDSAGAYLMATEQALLALATVEAGQSTFQQMKQQLVEQPEEQPEEQPVVDKENLTLTISEVEKLDRSKLTEKSDQELNAALEQAISVLENEEATQQEVDEVRQLLEEVLGNLKERAPPVTVKVRVETHEKTLVEPIELEVEPFDLKEYINNQNNGKSVLHENPRAIHAIIRALESVEGLNLKDDNEFGLDYGGNYIQKIGKDGEFTSGFLSGWMYFVNNEYAPVGVGDFKVKDGDSIVMYYTPNFTDSTYSWFDQEAYQVEVDEQLEVELFGDQPTENAHLLIDEKPYKEQDELVLVNDKGLASVTLTEPGVYHLSANRENNDGERNIVRPFAVVEVIEKEEIEEQPEVKPEEKPEVDPEEQPEAKPEEKPEVDPEEQPEVKPEEKPEVDPEEQPEAKPEEKPEVDPEEQPEAKPEVNPEEQPEVRPEEKPELDVGTRKSLEKVAQYLLGNEVASEWEAISLYQAGYKLPKSYETSFYSKIESEIVNGLENGRFKITDAERLALGALALEKDPTNINGINLIELIYNSPDRKMWDGTVEDTMTYQGNNGLAFALIALDAGNFEIPEDAKWTREKLVAALLEAQREEGAWNLNDAFPSISIDITAMVLTSLAPYKDQPKVQEAIDQAVIYLSSVQTAEGGFDGGSFVGGITSEATSQVIIALTALGMDPTGKNFTKDKNLVEHLLSFQHTDGGFYHTIGESVSNNMATEQAFNALVAYKFFIEGKGSVYDFVGNNSESEEDIETPNQPEEPSDPSKPGESEEEEVEPDHKEDVEIPEEPKNPEQENSKGDEGKLEAPEENEGSPLDPESPEPSDKDSTDDENEANDSMKNDDNPEHQEADEEGQLEYEQSIEEETNKDNRLPKTATSIFNSLLFGSALLGIGFVLFVQRRKVV